MPPPGGATSDGSLAIWAGSIAVHMIDAALLRRTADAADGLPFHVACKKVPCLDAVGNRIEPSEPNAIKFERFIFDLMPLARNAIVVEVDPARAFAPLKNESGAKADASEHVREALAALHRDWLRQAGAEVDNDVVVEISPLFALRRGRVADEGAIWHANRGAEVFRRLRTLVDEGAQNVVVRLEFPAADPRKVI